MRIDAINGHEASKQILRVIFATDYNQTKYKPLRHGYTYVYYSPQSARFTFESLQRKKSTELIKRYQIIDAEDIVNITGYKYSFAQIAIGAIISRKLMTYREFFDIVKNHFEWLE